MAVPAAIPRSSKHGLPCQPRSASAHQQKTRPFRDASNSNGHHPGRKSVRTRRGCIFFPFTPLYTSPNSYCSQVAKYTTPTAKNLQSWVSLPALQSRIGCNAMQRHSGLIWTLFKVSLASHSCLGIQRPKERKDNPGVRAGCKWVCLLNKVAPHPTPHQKAV